MKVGVTGAAGFIGGYVVEELLANHHEVIAFDRLGRAPVDPRATVFLGDIRSATDMTELAAHCDAIIHLAGVLGTQETIQNPRPAAETNVQGGLNFLEACSQYDLPGVYICVGNHWMNSTYSISKTTVERFCAMFNKERGTRVNMVRAVNAYGPRQAVAPPFGPGKVRKIVPAFACRALSGMPVEVYGDGEQVSDMVAVQDLARSLVYALHQAHLGKVWDRVMEVGPAYSHTVNEVAMLVIASAISLGYEPVAIEHLPMRPGEVPNAKVVADVTTMDRFGFDRFTMLTAEEGILETVRWYHDTCGTHWSAP